MLKNHINNIHQESQRNFKCDSCGKSFKQLKALNEDEHIKKIHEGLEQKRHEYGSCGKSCSESRNLNQHNSCRTKKFQKYCEKSLSRKDALQSCQKYS